MSTPEVSLERPRNARIACRKCHARKVKCSGGMPCKNCCQADCATECHYPSRARRIKVDQSYIDGLIDEIHRLREAAQVGKPGRLSSSPAPIASEELPSNISVASINEHNNARDTNLATDANDAVRNPLIGERPFFFQLAPEMPLLVGEATEAAFATRLRQLLLGKSETYIPRTQNVLDETICSLWNLDPVWPKPARARFLLKVAFSTICRRYYLVRKSSTIQLLEQAIQNYKMCDTLSICKLYALFALGEVYSTRTYTSEAEFPGIRYFSCATRMLRVLSEQPRIDCVEIMLMLSIYSLNMNRRHSAYCIVAYALRFAIIMGLHLNVPQHQLPNRELQKHRNRVWWTTYTLDRNWAAMLAKPVSIQDDDIDLNLPSMSHLSDNDETVKEDFADTEYLTAALRVANLGAQITASIYNRRTRGNSISWRVQKALRDLGDWLQELPDSLRTVIDQVPPNATTPIITLHLYFNQCLILASRPVLLHVFRLHQMSSTSEEGAAPVEETALALSEACIRCARRSHHILTESWINGSFPTFDFGYTQYLFSASIILAISSLFRNAESQKDGHEFETATQIMSQLDQSGNFAATEFCKQIEPISRIVSTVISDKSQTAQDHCHRYSTRDGMPQFLQASRAQKNNLVPYSNWNSTEPSLQDLLSQPDFDLEFLDPSIIDENFQAFVWPTTED